METFCINYLGFRILIEDMQLCFNIYNKTNRLLCQEYKNSIWYWYLTMAIFFGLSKAIFRPMYIHKSYNQCVPEFTFYLCTLAWICSKERPKHVAIVRYQYHVLLLLSSWNKLFVLSDFVVFTRIVYKRLKI